MFKRSIEILLFTLIQVVGLIIAINTLNYLYPIQHKEVGFGITMYYSIIIFSILIFVYNFCVEFYKINIYILAIIFLIIAGILPIQSLDYRPFRSLMLIIFATIAFILSILISKWRTKHKKSMELQNGKESINFIEIEHKLEPKSEFYKKVENYYNLISDDNIPPKIMQDLINQITDIVYSDYNRFWKKYPKSRKRYSKLKLEDLEHPFIHYRIIDFLKLKDNDNYEKYSLILLKMNKKEFEELETYKHQYEIK